MQLPLKLREQISDWTGRLPEAELRRASQGLTERYKAEGRPPALRTEAEQIAYLTVRLPATYGAVRTALDEAVLRLEDFRPRSLLDLGSGPGTAIWAASEAFPSLQEIHAVEQEETLVRLGKELLAGVPNGAPHIRWTTADLKHWRPERNYDVVVASYSLGELPTGEHWQLIRQVWEVVDGMLLLVEPGTRRGFENVARAREKLVSIGAKLAAPCPHSLACPMQLAGDWCHFSTRVERTAEHRRLKGGELGYEDEKFSYVVASRIASRPAAARVVRHPLKLSGHTKLQLCTPKGLSQETITRSQKELYRQAKRAEWGSGWEE